jgi:hypothetical protein
MDDADALAAPKHASHSFCGTRPTGFAVMVSRELLPNGVQRAARCEQFRRPKGSQLDDQLRKGTSYDMWCFRLPIHPSIRRCIVDSVKCSFQANKLWRSNSGEPAIYRGVCVDSLDTAHSTWGFASALPPTLSSRQKARAGPFTLEDSEPRGPHIWSWLLAISVLLDPRSRLEQLNTCMLQVLNPPANDRGRVGLRIANPDWRGQEPHHLHLENRKPPQ